MAASSSQAPAALPAGCTFTPGQEAQASIAQDFNDKWAAYGNNNKSLNDWTGADTTNSVKLPDGRVAWIFSDTFLGEVVTEPDGTPSRMGEHAEKNRQFVHNTIVTQKADGTLDATLHDGKFKDGTHGALIQTHDGREATGDPAVGSSWYWLGDGTVESTPSGDKLRVFSLKFEKFGPGGWDFHWLSTAVATFSLPKMELESVLPTPSGINVQFGSGILEEADYTYIYGTEDLGSTKYMHLARVKTGPGGGVTSSWEYSTGTGWSFNPLDSKRLLPGVANEYSVTKVGNAYVLTTMDTKVPFNREIWAYTSCSPAGPWTGGQKIYTAPDYSFIGSNAFVYNAHAHPEFTGADGSLLISYNVNSLVFQDDLDDVRLYRPRFVRVKLPEIIGAS